MTPGPIDGQSFEAAVLDRTTRAVTNFTIGLLLILPAVISLSGDMGATVLTALVPVAVLPLAWGMSPRGYELRGRTLVVRRRMWRPFVAEVTGFSDHAEPWRLGLRTGGSGGAWGWWGRFRRGDIKGYRAYLTTRAEESVVGLTSSRGVIVVSPEDTTAFRAAIRKAVR